jgi:membrane-associated phospholipid phosphatase
MKGPDARFLLPHEALFGAFLLITWVRFGVALGFGSREALLYLALMAADAGLIAFCKRRPTRTRWVLRLLFHPVALNVVFLHMRDAIPRLVPRLMDGPLQRADTWLVGGNLSLRLEAVARPALTEILSICYLLFFPYLLISLVLYFRRDLDTLRAFLVGLMTIYGLGFLGYTLVPAAGPWVAMAGAFRHPLAGGPFTRWNDHLVRAGSNGVDVFPSLHCAVSSYLLLFDRRHARWRHRLYLLPCLGLWISTLYLRYHYLVDVLFGFALSAFALWLSARYEREMRP